MKLLNKINIWTIILNHIRTLKNSNSNKVAFDDVLTFFIIPIIGSSSLIYFKIFLTESATNIIITTLSILVGLLFNVVVIVFDIIKRDNSKKLKNEILNQLLTNISYSIIISITIIIFTLFTYISVYLVKIIVTWFVYFLIGNYFLTVLMVLKRMYKLFVNELEEIENDLDIN